MVFVGTLTFRSRYTSWFVSVSVSLTPRPGRLLPMSAMRAPSATATAHDGGSDMSETSFVRTRPVAVGESKTKSVCRKG